MKSMSKGSIDSEVEGSPLNRNKRNSYQHILSFADDSSQIRLYERDSELALLHDLQMSIVSPTSKETQHRNPRRIGLVHGQSGCGKTALCQAALSLEPSPHQPNDLREEMFLIEGKYNQLVTAATTTPYSAIIEAFNMLGKQVEKDYSSQMKECLEFEADILSRLIPSFRIYTSEQMVQAEEKNDGLSSLATVSAGDEAINIEELTKASERLAVAFQTFLRKFTDQVRPIAFFLDDMQWSDRYSQELRKFFTSRRPAYHVYALCKGRLLTISFTCALQSLPFCMMMN